MIRIDKQIEVDDGRKDIKFVDNITKEELLVIRQEMYEFYKVTYEEMKTDAGVAAFLIAVGLKIAKGIEE